MFPDGESQNWEDGQLVMIANDHGLLDSFQTLKYVNVALLTVLLYDYCLTFNIERRRIWTLDWRLPKCLFMFNRYILPPVFVFEGFSNTTNVGDTICDVRLFTPIPTFISVITVELMLFLRVLALYGNSSRLARFLIILSFLQLMMGSFFAGFVLSKTRSIAGHDIFTGCLFDVPNWGSLTWAPLFLIEGTLVILTIYKCRKYGQFTLTIKILARDSVVYFVGITVAIVFNIFYPLHHRLMGMALALPTSVLTSIAAARLSMNIRSVTVDRGIATLTRQSQSLPTLLFPRNSNGAQAGGTEGIGSVEAGLPPTDIPSRQEDEEIEGGYTDDEDVLSA